MNTADCSAVLYVLVVKKNRSEQTILHEILYPTGQSTDHLSNWSCKRPGWWSPVFTVIWRKPGRCQVSPFILTTLSSIFCMAQITLPFWDHTIPAHCVLSKGFLYKRKSRLRQSKYKLCCCNFFYLPRGDVCGAGWRKKTRLQIVHCRRVSLWVKRL